MMIETGGALSGSSGRKKKGSSTQLSSFYLGDRTEK